MKLIDAEYMFIECTQCGSKAKVSKNGGGGLWGGCFVYTLDEFLTDHHDCDTDKIRITWE